MSEMPDTPPSDKNHRCENCPGSTGCCIPTMYFFKGKHELRCKNCNCKTTRDKSNEK